MTKSRGRRPRDFCVEGRVRYLSVPLTVVTNIQIVMNYLNFMWTYL